MSLAPVTIAAVSAASDAAWEAAARGGTEVTGPLTQREVMDYGHAYVPGFRDAIAAAAAAAGRFGVEPSPERHAAMKVAANTALGL